jgi:hypothetical protein
MRGATTYGAQEGAQAGEKRNWSRQWDSNPRPAHYECAALPLSYVGFRQEIIPYYPQQQQPPQPAPGIPISSSVWNDEPHPQIRTALGLSILKPPPNTSST